MAAQGFKQGSRLTHHEYYLLVEYLKANAQTVGKKWASELVEECSEAVGCVVDDGTIRKACAVVGITIARKAPAGAGRAKLVSPHRTEIILAKILARELVKLMHKLGETPSSEVFQILSLEVTP